MKYEEQYLEAYDRLNAEQKKAVDTIEGPVFVVAGPGTGKTQVLTLRIANILRQTDTPPESILALTFTEAASYEMRARLTKIIGSRASKVRMHTFHGFAENIIARFPDQFPRIIGAHIATDAERAEILDAVLLNTPVQHLRPFGDSLYYHPHVARAIGVMKRENITPTALEERLHEEQDAFEKTEGKIHEKGKYAGQMKGDFITLKKRIEKTEDLLLVYQAYEAALTEARRYDFEDLILEVVRALEEDESFRLQVQESVLYVLADEHQDANKAQNALLEHISGFHERPNLFIVGDEKQAIYRFQGADLDNVQYFRSKFEGTQILTLIDNYRSTQSILDIALSLITASPDERLSRVPLLANSAEEAKPLSLITCSSNGSEMATLAANIERLLEEGVLPADIAVLVRRNKDVADVARALTRAGIPTTGAGDEDALQNRFVQAVIRLMRVAVNPLDTLLASVLTLPGFSLSAADIARITQYARKEKRTIFSLLGDTEALADAKIQNVEGAKELFENIERLAKLASYERPAVVAKATLEASNLIQRILNAEDRAENLSALRGFLYALEDISRREHGALTPRALALLDLYEARGISLSGRGNEEDTSRVKVMTVHRSKGREFTYVFLPLLTSKAWSTRARAEHFQLRDVLSGSNGLEDERRLLYVAITRAKKHATLSYSVSGEDGRGQDPSELLSDLHPELIQAAESATEPADWFLTPTKSNNDDAPTEDDLATLRATFFAQGLSPTAFNNYLQCPWKYFYVNLLRIPEVENKFMLFGTAIHAALDTYAEARTRDSDIGTEGLIRAFLYSLERAPLSEQELSEMKEKGERALAAWWNERHASWPAQARSEVAVEAEIPLHEGNEMLRIRGKLDRVDEVAGGVNVVDYKTGKPKSRNELMGATKDADGNYYRQLTFYKLLLARAEEKDHVHEGILEFVEPDEKGRIKSESFTITDEEVQTLEQLIQTSAQEITTLSFWNETCNEEECTWCKLRFEFT